MESEQKILGNKGYFGRKGTATNRAKAKLYVSRQNGTFAFEESFNTAFNTTRKGHSIKMHEITDQLKSLQEKRHMEVQFQS